jgi:hypothetical protein
MGIQGEPVHALMPWTLPWKFSLKPWGINTMPHLITLTWLSPA